MSGLFRKGGQLEGIGPNEVRSAMGVDVAFLSIIYEYRLRPHPPEEITKNFDVLQ